MLQCGKASAVSTDDSGCVCKTHFKSDSCSLGKTFRGRKNDMEAINKERRDIKEVITEQQLRPGGGGGVGVWGG